jgi:hypothetical protein
MLVIVRVIFYEILNTLTDFLGCETVEALAVVKALLLSNRRMRAFMIPPLFRLHPSGFKDDIAVCVVLPILLTMIYKNTLVN